MTSDHILDTLPAHLLQLDSMGNITEFRCSPHIIGHPLPTTANTNIDTLLPDNICRIYLNNIKKLKQFDLPVCFDYFVDTDKQRYFFKAHARKQDGAYIFLLIPDRLPDIDIFNTNGLLTTLTRGFAHDFNNILASILGYADLTLAALKEMDNQDELIRYIGEVIDEGEKARHLTSQLQILAHARPGQTIVIDSVPFIKEIVDATFASLPDKINFSIHTESNIPAILIDPTRLYMIIQNLCMYTHTTLTDNEGHILININHATCQQCVCRTCRECFDGEHIEIAITDVGEDINDSLSHGLSDSQPGSGEHDEMRLTTINNAVHQCHGHIVIDSINNYGTTMRILLPAHNDE